MQNLLNNFLYLDIHEENSIQPKGIKKRIILFPLVIR